MDILKFLGGLSLHLNHLIPSTSGNLQLAIWDTSFWTFFVKFCQVFSFLDEGVITYRVCGLVLCARVPRLNYRPIFSQCETCGGYYRLSKAKYHFFDVFMRG